MSTSLLSLRSQQYHGRARGVQSGIHSADLTVLGNPSPAAIPKTFSTCHSRRIKSTSTERLCRGPVSPPILRFFIFQILDAVCALQLPLTTYYDLTRKSPPIERSHSIPNN